MNGDDDAFVVTLTASQRAALIDLIMGAIADGLAVHVDIQRRQETRPQDLLALVLRAQALKDV